MGWSKGSLEGKQQFDGYLLKPTIGSKHRKFLFLQVRFVEPIQRRTVCILYLHIFSVFKLWIRMNVIFLIFLKLQTWSIVYQHSEFTNNHLEFACLMLGKSKQVFSPMVGFSWWFTMGSNPSTIQQRNKHKSWVFWDFFFHLCGARAASWVMSMDSWCFRNPQQPIGMYKNPVNNRINYHITWWGFIPPTVCLSNKKTWANVPTIPRLRAIKGAMHRALLYQLLPGLLQLVILMESATPWEQGSWNMTPTQTSYTHKSPENYHTFGLFDSQRKLVIEWPLMELTAWTWTKK